MVEEEKEKRRDRGSLPAARPHDMPVCFNLKPGVAAED